MSREDHLSERLVAVETENSLCAEDRAKVWVQIGELSVRIGRHKDQMNGEIEKAFDKLDKKLDDKFDAQDQRIRKVEWALIVLICTMAIEAGKYFGWLVK